MKTQKIKLSRLERLLQDVADTLRGKMDAAEYKEYILGMLFLKRMSDVFDQKRTELRKRYKHLPKSVQDELLEERTPYGETFFVPKRARWHESWVDENGNTVPPIKHLKNDIGSYLNKALAAIEEENSERLSGIFKDRINFNRQVNGKPVVKNADLETIIGLFNKFPALINDNFEIIYQGFTHNAEIEDAKGADAMFEDVFSDYRLDERLQILGFGSRDAYLNSEVTIRAKAKNMMAHYVSQIFNGGFKAQIIANSREAAVIYKRAVEEALVEEISKLEQDNPNCIDIEKLKKVRAAVVISGRHNDLPVIKQYTEKSYHDRSITSFKLAYGDNDEEDNTIDGNVGVVIVNNMLTTGFDAPIEQVLYLDRVIIAHNLLQAITRPNRVEDQKDYGFVVDYVGIGHHLREAILKTDQRQEQVDSGEINDIIESFGSTDDLLRSLVEAHENILNFITSKGINDLEDEDVFYEMFYDEENRSKYIDLYRAFSSAFNALQPAKEALDYYHDWLMLTEINALAMKHISDSRLSMKGITPKLVAIANKYLIDKGIDEKVKPISIMAEDFIKDAQKRKTDKSRAAQVEHAIRNYIEINIDEDPELFASFAEAIEQILKDFAGNWKKIYEELEKLREKIRNREREVTYGLDRKAQMPFFRILKKELWGDNTLTEDEIGKNVELTTAVFEVLHTELQLVGFWESPSASIGLREKILNILLLPEFCTLPNIVAKRSEIISRVMEIARAKHSTILNFN